jgi:IclR family transcriptional regulator, KDG regulon repressor
LNTEEKDLIASIQKAIKIIETFSQDEGLQSIKELTYKTGYSKTAVHRIVQTLVHEGWMLQDDSSKRYGLGYGMLGYEKLVLMHDSLVKICDPFMKELRNEFNETITLAIIEKTHARCIHKIESEHHIKLISIVGQTMPLYSGATAKCILAFKDKQYVEDYLKNTKLEKFTVNTVTDNNKILEELDKIKTNGYATSESEVDMDTFTVSVPIFTKNKTVIGSLSTSSPKYRYTPETEEKIIKRTLEVCNKINAITDKSKLNNL